MKLDQEQEGNLVMGEKCTAQYAMSKMRKTDDAEVALWNSAVGLVQRKKQKKDTTRRVRKAKGLMEKRTFDKETLWSSVEDTEKENINMCLQSCLANVVGGTNKEQKTAIMLDLVLMIFQIRDCRKTGVGKGQRAQSWMLWMSLYEHIPQTMIAVLPLFPHYGYWKDLNWLLMATQDEEKFLPARESIVQIYAKQLMVDHQLAADYESDPEKENASKPNLSLAGKWAPRFGKSCHRFTHSASEIAKVLAGDLIVPDDHNDGELYLKIERKRRYAAVIRRIMPYLDVPEVKMSANQWGDLKMDKIPGLCLKMSKKMLIDESNDDRKACKANYEAFMEKVVKGEKSAKGTSVGIMDLVDDLISDDYELAQAQFQDHIDNVRNAVEKNDTPLGKGLVLSDVSPSMKGEPMKLSVAMGVLVSQLAEKPWKDKVVTFEFLPKLVDISKMTTLHEKCVAIRRMAADGSTNIVAAFQLILDLAIKNQLQPEELPSWLMIVSDMQFDQAHGKRRSPWEPMHQTLERMFEDAGMKAVGKPYALPMMIYWNAAAKGGLPVDAKQTGAQMVSGASSNLVKLFLETGKMSPTPWDTMRKALDAPCYQDVVSTVAAAAEAPFFDTLAETIRQKQAATKVPEPMVCD